VAFAAGLRVILRPEARRSAGLDFLEFRLIGLMSRIVGDAVAFIVKPVGASVEREPDKARIKLRAAKGIKSRMAY
jgi:hypothetical protein